MGRRNKRPPPRVYHDGLIPATHDTYQSYPEVVGDDYDQVKHEKSYPELAPPQDDPEQQPQHHQHQQDPPDNQQQQQQHQQSNHPHHPSTILPPPTAHGTNTNTHTNTTNHHLSSALPNLSPLSAPPQSALIHPSLAGLPRPSGVHSLRQAWSDPGDPDDPHAVPLDADRPPLWKRPIFWVVLVAGAVIVVLAGILGGVASGRVGTAFGTGSGAGSGSGKGEGGGGGGGGGGSTVSAPTCPGDANRNYTTGAAAGVLSKTFRIQCNANYPGGDGALGLKKGSVDTIAGCFDACAREEGCVAAVFMPGDAPECWLKEFVGVVQAGGKAEGMVSGVLWQ